jgi:hypothetical protein
LSLYALPAVAWACQRAEVYNRHRSYYRLDHEAFARETAEYARLAAASDRGWAPGLGQQTAQGVLKEGGVQATLLRCVIGPLPFRPVQIEASWRTPAVVALANTVYEERRWAEMSVLADALEEAGCTNADVLEHCRSPVHTRGCWLTDLLLGKG